MLGAKGGEDLEEKEAAVPMKGCLVNACLESRDGLLPLGFS